MLQDFCLNAEMGCCVSAHREMALSLSLTGECELLFLESVLVPVLDLSNSSSLVVYEGDLAFSLRYFFEETSAERAE